MRKIDEKFINLANKIAMRGEFRTRHGCVITRGKDVIATGFNRDIGIDHVLSHYGVFYSIHAELDAIRKLPYEFEESCTLYSVRHNWNMAKPCAKCLRVINKTGIIRRVVYSVKPGIIEEMFV